MKKAKAITAGAIALTLTLGGGVLASQYVNAAAATDTQSTQSTATADGQLKRDHAGKRGGFKYGFQSIQEQLLAYLAIDEATLKTKLESLTLAELAAEHGKTREELKAKLIEWLDAAQAEAEANAPAEADADSDKQKVTVDTAEKAEKLLDSKGFGNGKPGGGKGGFGGNIEAIAEALGLTAAELKTELDAGKTIADVAGEKGVSVQTVIDAQLSGLKEKLSEELAAGTITQEQHDDKWAKAVQHATKHVNGELPARGEAGRGGKGFHGGKGQRGERPDSAASTESDTAETDAAV